MATAGSLRSLPPGWRMVKFGEMAENITDRVDDPTRAGVERYVGLEHLDPESLKIRRWGKPTDVEATKLRFRPGDIIFGKRRFYQRKLAVADFEGICSAHALVLRAKKGVVEDGFLPFFMLGDEFFDRAMMISVGGLSPTINWSTLARQEFALPPIPEQRRIAEVLWAAEKAEEAWLELGRAAGRVMRKAMENAFVAAVGAEDAGRLSDLAAINPKPPRELADDSEVSFVPMESIVEGGGMQLRETRPVGAVRKGYTYFADGDVVFPKITPCMENGKGALAGGLVGGIGYGSTEFFIVRPRDPSDAAFLYHLTMSPRFRRRAKATMRGSAGQQRVPRSFLLDYALRVPSQVERGRIGSMLDGLLGTSRAANAHANQLHGLRRSLLSATLDHKTGV